MIHWKDRTQKNDSLTSKTPLHVLTYTKTFKINAKPPKTLSPLTVHDSLSNHMASEE